MTYTLSLTAQGIEILTCEQRPVLCVRSMLLEPELVTWWAQGRAKHINFRLTERPSAQCVCLEFIDSGRLLIAHDQQTQEMPERNRLLNRGQNETRRI